MSLFPEYENHDGLGLAELIRRREVSAAEVVDAAIDRIERRNPALNAVLHPRFEAARAEAAGPLPDGPFAGVPFLVKDLLAQVDGMPMECGSRLMAGFRSDHDSELVRRYRAAGVVILGKTATPEFGLQPTTESAYLGPTRNPWNPSRTPGGSSGGSAAAVAAGMVPLAHGNDGGGSIRIPAAYCGLFGLKPSRGRVPLGPDLGEPWFGLVAEHVLTRSVRDSAAMLDATAGMDVGAPYAAPIQERPFLVEAATPPGRLRIAFTAEPLIGGEVAPEARAGVERTVRLLADLGHEVVEAAPAVDIEQVRFDVTRLLAAALRATVDELAELRGIAGPVPLVEPGTWAIYAIGRRFPADQLTRCIDRMNGIRRGVGEFFTRYDVLLTPTTAGAAFPLGTYGPTPGEVRLLKLLRALRAGRLLGAGLQREFAAKALAPIPFTPLFNITGQPAMSVPLHWSDDGLPVGMQFVGRFGDEATLFRLAGQLEQAAPWFARRPAQ